jgi:hypothetical protein
MRQLKPVLFVFALLVLSATLAAAETAAPQVFQMTPEFLTMIGAAGNCDSQAAPAADIGVPAVGIGVPQPKLMACDPWVQACTPPGGSCPACGFHCVRTCSDGCCDCSCW